MKETRHAGRSGVWAAAAAMAVCALLAAYLGLSALSTLEWQGVYWQDSRQFQTLCQSWNDRVATSVADSIALESDTISYVERQQLEGAMDAIRRKYGRSAIAFGDGEEGEPHTEE